MKKTAQTVIPVALLLASEQSGASAIKADNQAHVQELSSLIEQAMTETNADSQTVSNSEALSATQINTQIQSTVEEAIKS